MRSLPHARTFLTLACLAALPCHSRAQDVDPGYDLFRTEPSASFHDFSGSPIPPDFFAPGSDPFSGTVSFMGMPPGAYAGCPLDDLFLVDTIVRRPDPAMVAPIPSQDQIPIEIVALSLQSVSPIVVTYGGLNPENWRLRVDLSPSAPQFQGIEWVYHTAPSGGAFDTYLPIVPRFTFERESDNLMRILDYGITGALVEVSQVGAPWAYNSPPAGSCTSNFCASPGRLLLLTGASSRLALTAICPQPPVQGETSTWGSVKAIYR